MRSCSRTPRYRLLQSTTFRGHPAGRNICGCSTGRAFAPRGAATYTFDDSQPSQIEHYGELQAAGVPMTFYLSSGWADTSPQYEATWRQAVRDGHEIGNHTIHHCMADLTGCAAGAPLADPLAEIDDNTTYITEHTRQRTVPTMAS